MDVSWSDLGAALALVLVIEGVLPFLNPHQAKETYRMASLMPDGSLRIVGLVSMLIGLVLLFLVR